MTTAAKATTVTIAVHTVKTTAVGKLAAVMAVAAPWRAIATVHETAVPTVVNYTAVLGAVRSKNGHQEKFHAIFKANSHGHDQIRYKR